MNPSSPAESLESTIAKINNAASQVSSCGPIEEIAIPPQLCGVYFLLRQDAIVYIGQSINVIQRIGTHVTEHKKRFDRVLYLPCPQGLLDFYERELIFYFKPRYNRQHLETTRSAEKFIVYALSEAPDGLKLPEIVAKAQDHGVWAQTPWQLERNLVDALKNNPQVECSHRDWKYRLKTSTDGGQVSINGMDSISPSVN